MFIASQYWITVVELPNYENEIEEFLTASEAEGLITLLAQEPDAGTVIPDTCGLRKISWGGRGRKGGGAQVVYYFRDLNMPLYLLAAFPRGARLRLTKAEKNQMREKIEAIVASHWRQQISPLINPSAVKPTG